MKKMLLALAALPLAFAAAPAHAVGVTFGEGFIPGSALLEDFTSIGGDQNDVGEFSPSVGHAVADDAGIHVFPFSVDTGSYGFVTRNLASATLTTTGDMKYFGLLWGTLDTFNTLSFLNDGVEIASFTGADIAAMGGLVADGTAVVYANFWFGDQVYDQVVFATTTNSFEFDNVRVAPTPLPAALALFGSAIVGMGAFGLRRRRAA